MRSPETSLSYEIMRSPASKEKVSNKSSHLNEGLWSK